MADMSRVNEKLAQIAQKVDELVAYKNSNPSDGSGGDGGQSQINEVESRLDEILARIP